MKFFFIIAAVLFVTAGYCQKAQDTGMVDLDKLKRQIDSSNKMMETLGNSMYKKIEDDAIKRTNENSIRYFEQMQAEQREAQKKAMYKNIGLGVLFLAILIVGIVRRRKKPIEKR